jgi:hypothetical protein
MLCSLSSGCSHAVVELVESSEGKGKSQGKGFELILSLVREYWASDKVKRMEFNPPSNYFFSAK